MLIFSIYSNKGEIIVNTRHETLNVAARRMNKEYSDLIFLKNEHNTNIHRIKPHIFISLIKDQINWI